VSSRTALVILFAGIPVRGLLGLLSARRFNRLGKYTSYMGNITSGNITNANDIAKLMT
jgi:hypothetical protein